MRLLKGYSILYTSLSVRVSMIGAKLVCLSVTSKQAKIAPEWCHGVQGWKWRCPLTMQLHHGEHLYEMRLIITTRKD